MWNHREPLPEAYRRLLRITRSARTTVHRSVLVAGFTVDLRLLWVASTRSAGRHELQAARAPQINPVAPAPSHDEHEDLLASRTPHDHARRVDVAVDLSHGVDRTAAGTGRLDGRFIRPVDIPSHRRHRASRHLPF